MKELSILELLSNICEDKYYRVTADLKDYDPSFEVSSVISNASRFNFSIVCRNYEGTMFKTINVIKDGVLTDLVEYITVYSEDLKVNYKIKDMPIFPQETCSTLESVTFALLEEKRLDEVFSEYKYLKKSLLVTTSEEVTEKVEDTKDTTEEEVPVETTVVPCVTYQITTKLDPTVNVNSIRESCLTWEDANKEYARVRAERTSARFRTRILIYELENNLCKGEIAWSEIKPLPRSKKKSFQEANVIVSGEELTIRRVFWNEEINL